MSNPHDRASLDDVLANSAWIRRLARRLVADAAERDDIVQEVWLAALTQSQRADEMRPWLGGVLRNVARMHFRAGGRRLRREQAGQASTSSTPEDLIERVEIERDVVTALLEIDEPYLSTLLLRYYEDLSAAEIARRLAIPAATVRSRLKRGLDELRTKLDARTHGDRRRWALALVPTAATARGGLGKVIFATIGGVLVKVTTKAVAAVAVVFLFVGGGVGLWRHSSGPSEVSQARPGVAWRVPGGIGARTSSPPTLHGVAVPSWFGQRGAPLRRIAGRVTFAGHPVANATVELASELTDAGLLRPAKLHTGTDGRFDFGTQPPAKFSVAATADKYSPAIVDVDTRDPTGGAGQLELRLGGCESALSGHVSDSSGGPIPSAQVCLAPPRASACVSADADGAYTMCLSPSRNIVSVAAAGYGAIFDRFEYVGHRVQRDYVLAPEAVIVGRVVRADTNAPIVGASVRVTSTNEGQRFGSPGATTTTDQGHFTIAGLASGRYRVVAFAEGLATTEAVEVSLEAARPSGEVLLRLLPGSRLSGVVTDGRDAIVGATVSLGIGPSSIDAVTQSDGSFVLDPVGRGLATLAVREYNVRAPRTITIDRPDVSGVRVLVDAMGSIAGLVTYRGKPLAGARVYPSTNIEPVLSQADGSYVARGLAPGRYRVSAGNETGGAFGTGAELTLAKGEKRTGIDIEVKNEGAISGVVVEADGNPVAGASVAFEKLDSNDAGQDVTAPDGTFRVRGLMGGGDYRARVRAAAQRAVLLKFAADQPPTVNLEDSTSEVTGVRLTVQRDHLTISGSTVDSDGQPLSDVRVVAFRPDDRTGAMFDDSSDHASAISTTDGSFEIKNLDAATYVLRARAGDGSEGVMDGVAAGQKNVVVAVRRAGAIDGTLVGFSSQPAVRAVRQLGVNFTNLFATVDGTAFHFRGLSPGTYQVAAIGAETDAKSVDVVPGQTANVTLQSRGSTTIRGRVVEWSGGAGVPGMRCTAGLRNTPGAPMWIDSVVGFSDESGAFVLEGAPTGSVSVGCVPTATYWTDGQADLTLNLTDDQDASCEVPVVKFNPDAPAIHLGAALDPIATPVRFNVVPPNSTAARAGVRVGDVVTTVDGVSVAKLTPWGVVVLIGQRPPGTIVHLGLSRGGQATNADLMLPSH